MITSDFAVTAKKTKKKAGYLDPAFQTFDGLLY